MPLKLPCAVRVILIAGNAVLGVRRRFVKLGTAIQEVDNQVELVVVHLS